MTIDTQAPEAAETKAFNLTIQAKVSIETLADVLCAALEGGTHYWGAASDIKRVDVPEDSVIGWRYDSADYWDAEDPAKRFGTVNLDTILLGMERIATGKVQVRDDIRSAVIMLALHGSAETSDWDSETADTIVQAGLFNEIVFG